jgi:hypothetical protein
VNGRTAARTRSITRTSPLLFAFALASTALAVIACHPASPKTASSDRTPRPGPLKPTPHAPIGEDGKAPPGARWLPVTTAGGNEVEVLPDGTRRAILRRLRVEQGPDGSIRTATDLLPEGTAGPVLTLPDRLGGGILYLTTVGGTLVHRAPAFLAPLEPLARFRAAPLLPVAATDRLLLRAADGSRLHALELPTGHATTPVGVPVAPRIGSIVFADAYHGLAVADLVGLVATTDAGASWRPVPLPDQAALGEVLARADGYTVATATGRYTVDLNGQISQTEAVAALPPNRAAMTRGRVRGPTRVPTLPEALPPIAALARPGPLGALPAQTTIERGIRVGVNDAVVAANGRVVRVSLTDFSVLDLSRDKTSLDRDDSCRSVALGATVAFVCGGEGTGTSIHEASADLTTREIVRFREPRSVRASGQGALAVSGGCAPEANGNEVCVLDGIHPPRTIRLLGESGRERILPLSDGRVVIVEPPQLGVDGRAILVRLDGSKTSLALSFAASGSTPAAEEEPAKPTLRGSKSPVSIRAIAEAAAKRPPPTASGSGSVAEGPLREGFWTHDWSEVSLAEIATWVVSGSEIRGVRIDLTTGLITAGTPRPTAQTSVAGLYGFMLNDGGRGADTIDGGKTWVRLDQPDLLKAKADGARLCSSLGCVLRFAETPWVRVGWGEPEESAFLDAAVPRSVDDLVVDRSFSLDCDDVKIRPPRKDPPKKTIPVRTSSTPLLTMDGDTDGSMALRVGDWDSFRGFAGPVLPKGFGGYDVTSAPSGVHAALYAWTPYGAMNRDVSHWQGRFFDKYDTSERDGVRSSAVGTTPYISEEDLATALGYRSSVVALQPLIDPGGHAALVGMGDSSGGWELVSLVEGRTPARLATPADGAWPAILPSQASAAYLESLDAWVVATEEGSATVLRVASAGQTRDLATLPRVGLGSHDPVMVVRRARTTGVGVLVGGLNAAATERVVHVLPIDLDDGHIGEIRRLGPTSLAGRPLRACEPGEDGWLVDMGVGGSPAFSFRASDAKRPGARVDDASVRARLDEGKVCVDAIAAKLVALPGSADGKAARGTTTHRNKLGMIGTIGVAAVAGGGGGGGGPHANLVASAVGTKGPEGDPVERPAPSTGAPIPLVALDASGTRLSARCHAR